jgi:hypothetical protein
VASSVGPSLAIYDGKVYAIWKGEGSDQGLYYAFYDGTWHGQTQIAGVGSSVGASLATVGNKLYAVWKGEGSDQGLYYAYYDGTWHGQTPIAGVGSSVGAVIANFNGNLYAMCKGKDSNPSLYNGEFQNNSWPATWANDIPGNTGPDPVTTAVSFPMNTSSGNANYWLADSAGNGAALTETTVTIIVVDDIIPDSPDSAGANPGNYSFQINCLGRASAPQTDSFVAQQFGFRIAAEQLFFWVNCFLQAGSNAFINWDSRLLGTSGWVALPNNQLPSGWQLTTTLVTDATTQAKVISFAFTVVKPDGTLALKSPPLALQNLNNSQVTQGNLSPNISFQVVMVGENKGETCNFSGGKGLLLCNANNNLSANTSPPSNSPQNINTVEKSNVQYASLPASYPNGEFYQPFGAGTI